MRERKIMAWVAAAIGFWVATVPGLALARTCDDAASWSGASPAFGGASAYDHGEFVHQDYIYDDHGAGAGATGPPLGDTDATPAGTFTYPGPDDPRYLNNAADLREVRMRLEGDVLAIRVELNTMTQPDAAVVGLGIGLQGDVPDGPSMAWPHGAQLTTAGTDAVVTMWGAGADLAKRGAEPVGLDGCADVASNALEARLPLSALGGVAGALRLFAAAGVWDAAAKTWSAPNGIASPSAPRAYDIGFVPGEGANSPDTHGAMNWFDVKQAGALGAGNIDAYSGVVDLGLLRSGATRPFRPYPGFYEVVYHSSTSLSPDNEGWRTGGRFEGPYQPYSLYIPAAHDSGRPLGLFMYFHGATRNHTQLVSGSNIHQQLGERLNLALVGALGRGGLGGTPTDDAANVLKDAYQGPGMLDAREVLADVQSRLDIDPARRYLGGYSMGGIAVYQLAGVYPDEWAGAVLWAGTKPNDSDEWLAGARWVPMLFVHAPTDEVVTYESSLQSTMALESYGYMFELHSHPGEHEHQATTDDYHQPAEFFSGLRAPTNPARVTYPRVPAQDALKLGIKADRAYWLSEVTTTAAIGTADVTSLALGGTEPGLETIGPTPEDGPPDPYIRTGQRYVWPGKALARVNGLTGTLTAVTSATVDAHRAGLDPTAPVTLQITTDAPATLVLAGLCGQPPSISGDATLEGEPSRLAVRFAKAGEHAATLSACAPALGLPPARSCLARRQLKLRVRAPHGRPLRSARVYVRGRLVRTLRGRRTTRAVTLRKLPAGRVRVKIVARTRAGRRLVQTRTYRICAAAASSTRSTHASSSAS